MSAADSKQAQSYLIDPLNAPEPSQETGLGSHFVAPQATGTSTASSSTNPFRRGTPEKTGASTHVRQVSRGSNPGSPSFSKFPNYRDEAFGGHSPRRSLDGPPSYDAASGRRRGSSLRERFPGDESHKPLDIIRRDSRKAQKAPHLNKRHIPGADSIDKLDPTINKLPYHHEGPYDAASLARNTNLRDSPIAALETTNREALKATAPENVKNSLNKHVPLDGVAIVPPGEEDRLGHVYNYEEGPNEMFEGRPDGGQYKRYEGVDYDENDIHGQGEPSYSLDRALQNHTIHERDFDGQRGIELSDRPLMSGQDKGKDRKKFDDRDPVEIAGGDARYSDLQHAADVDAHPIDRKVSLKEGLKRRIGSLRHKGLDEFLP